MSASLVGSEMCIRDRKAAWLMKKYPQFTVSAMQKFEGACKENPRDLFYICLLYTSDAADDM
eukprot:10183952-Alexandrium_andersonii.AAC.1